MWSVVEMAEHEVRDLAPGDAEAGHVVERAGAAVQEDARTGAGIHVVRRADAVGLGNDGAGADDGEAHGATSFAWAGGNVPTSRSRRGMPTPGPQPDPSSPIRTPTMVLTPGSSIVTP